MVVLDFRQFFCALRQPSEAIGSTFVFDYCNQ